MDEALERKLADKYSFMEIGTYPTNPTIIRVFGENYYFGFCECNNGWYDLLDALCSSIKHVYESNNVPLDIKVDQIKEKMGTLRFYATPGGPENVQMEVDKLIADAQRKSETICEECGKPGTLLTGYGRVQVICDECFNRLFKKK